MPERSLSRREFDQVIRRAAELASSDPDAEGALTESELYRIAGEVGLDAHHVRRALGELRSGAGPGGGVVDRLFGPAVITAFRSVPGTPEELAGKLDYFLVASQLLQRVRRGPSILQYRPAVDWASQLARAASFSSRKYYIAAAKSVEIRLEPEGDGRTSVELLVDPGTRADSMWGAALGGGSAGVAAGVGSAVGLAGLGVLTAGAAVVGAAVGAGIAAGVSYAVGQSHRRKVAEVRDEVEGVLDTLETGASLEPPPASWRRWVKRHFHGVARDLMGADSAEWGDVGDSGDGR